MDAYLRRLEKGLQATGSPIDEARWLRARSLAGEGSEPLVCVRCHGRVWRGSAGVWCLRCDQLVSARPSQGSRKSCPAGRHRGELENRARSGPRGGWLIWRSSASLVEEQGKASRFLNTASPGSEWITSCTSCRQELIREIKPWAEEITPEPTPAVLAGGTRERSPRLMLALVAALVALAFVLWAFAPRWL